LHLIGEPRFAFPEQVRIRLMVMTSQMKKTLIVITATLVAGLIIVDIIVDIFTPGPIRGTGAFKSG